MVDCAYQHSYDAVCFFRVAGTSFVMLAYDVTWEMVRNNRAERAWDGRAMKLYYHQTVLCGRTGACTRATPHFRNRLARAHHLKVVLITKRTTSPKKPL